MNAKDRLKTKCNSGNFKIQLLLTFTLSVEVQLMETSMQCSILFHNSSYRERQTTAQYFKQPLLSLPFPIQQASSLYLKPTFQLFFHHSSAYATSPASCGYLIQTDQLQTLQRKSSDVFTICLKHCEVKLKRTILSTVIRHLFILRCLDTSPPNLV